MAIEKFHAIYTIFEAAQYSSSDPTKIIEFIGQEAYDNSLRWFDGYTGQVSTTPLEGDYIQKILVDVPAQYGGTTMFNTDWIYRDMLGQNVTIMNDATKQTTIIPNTAIV